MKLCLKKFLSLLLCLVMLVSYSGCASGKDRDDEEEDRPKKSRISKTEQKSEQKDKPKTEQKTKQETADSDYENLVICGREIYDDEYFLKSRNGDDYLFVSYEVFHDTFIIPYIPDPYPDMINKEVGKISIIWTNDNDFHLQVDIEEGSDKAVINGYEYDLGMAPIRQNNAFYIPSNLFISLLEMEIKHDKELDAIIIERKEDFPKEILVGTWSNTETSPFTKYTDIVSGSIKYPTVVTAYKFNKDGSYRCLMVGMDSFQGHVVVDLKGKYKIHGNTVALYDILETFYKGMPPQLEYKDKRYDSNRYAHIHNNFSDEERIRFDATLLRRIE